MTIGLNPVLGLLNINNAPGNICGVRVTQSLIFCEVFCSVSSPMAASCPFCSVSSLAAGCLLLVSSAFSKWPGCFV